MAGKWAFLKGRLTPLPPEAKFDEGADYQTKVDQVKAELIGLELQDLGIAYNTLRAEKDEIEEALSDTNLQIEAHTQVLTTLMQDQGLSSVKLKTGESFLLKDEPHTTVVDKTALREWFEAHGLREILSVNWQTLNAMVKGILEDPFEANIDHNPDDPNSSPMRPRDMPAGIDIFMKTSLSRRKK